MGVSIEFFQKGVYAGGAGAVTLYSGAFEVTDYANITPEMRIYGISAANAFSAQLQESSDPALGDNSWADLSTPLSASTVSVQKPASPVTNFLRFVRMKLTCPITTYATLEVLAVARESS
jgi:hypothetical protein